MKGSFVALLIGMSLGERDGRDLRGGDLMFTDLFVETGLEDTGITKCFC